jgi:hypothetical protein
MKTNKNNNIVVADINQEVASQIKPTQMITSFPTILYFAENGNKREVYEDSSISLKDRTIDSFVEWIQSKNTPSSSLQGGTRRTLATRTKRIRGTRRSQTTRTKRRKSN